MNNDSNSLMSTLKELNCIAGLLISEAFLIEDYIMMILLEILCELPDLLKAGDKRGLKCFSYYSN